MGNIDLKNVVSFNKVSDGVVDVYHPIGSELSCGLHCIGMKPSYHFETDSNGFGLIYIKMFHGYEKEKDSKPEFVPGTKMMITRLIKNTIWI